MTTNELKNEIERLKKLRFYEEMADFMDWKKYYEYTARIKELEDELKKRGEL